MAKRKDGSDWGTNLVPGASDAILYPHVRLGFAVLKQAINDFREADPLNVLPALCWWLEDAPDWLAMLELHDPDDDRYFLRLLENCDNGKKRKTGRPVTE